MPAQGKYAPALLARAEAGELTRTNTTKGTPQRKAVDRVTYLRRKAARPDVSAREALGGRPTRPRLRGITEEQRKRVAAGLGDADARRRFSKFRQSNAFPSWIPKNPADMDDQTAAILAGLPKALDARTITGGRNGWRDVNITTQPNGTHLITITPIRGNPFTFTLPDADATQQFLGVVRKSNYRGLSVDAAGFGSNVIMKREMKSSTPKKRKPKK